MPALFWERLDELIKTQKIVIDRLKGTRHPNFPDFIYPLDYGYLEGTASMDGNGIDLWSGTAPHRNLTAIACTVDTMKKDSEIKLIIGCTEEEIAIVETFLNSKFMSAIVVRRQDA
jgi:inorganic pyrophosphatase